jgi:hypothetical protein
LITSAASGEIVFWVFRSTAGGMPPPRRRSAYSCADRPAAMIAAWCSIGDNPSRLPGGTIHGMCTICDDGTS